MAGRSAVLLLRRGTWGHLLTSIVLLKGVTLRLAVSLMSINMTLRRMGDGLGIMIPFQVITIPNLVLPVILLHNVGEGALVSVGGSGAIAKDLTV